MVEPGSVTRVPPGGTVVQDRTGVALLTVIGSEVPWIELVGVSVAVIDCVPPPTVMSLNSLVKG